MIIIILIIDNKNNNNNVHICNYKPPVTETDTSNLTNTSVSWIKNPKKLHGLSVFLIEKNTKPKNLVLELPYGGFLK